jgi:hypothetical protein
VGTAPPATPVTVAVKVTLLPKLELAGPVTLPVGVAVFTLIDVEASEFTRL